MKTGKTEPKNMIYEIELTQVSQTLLRSQGRLRMRNAHVFDNMEELMVTSAKAYDR